ncbi:MAG: hypothetical protein AABZ28_04260, partial [Nitrospinota bacterium]
EYQDFNKMETAFIKLLENRENPALQKAVIEWNKDRYRAVLRLYSPYQRIDSATAPIPSIRIVKKNICFRSEYISLPV